MTGKVSNEQVLATLNRLDRFARLTDSQFRIPFTRITFGLDALIGLIPIAGEVIGFLMSGYILLEAQKLGAPGAVKVKMLRNVFIDVIVGLIPLVGDLADVAYKANIRNMRLLAGFIEQEYQITYEPPAPKRINTVLWLGLVVALLLIAGLALWYWYGGAIEAFA